MALTSRENPPHPVTVFVSYSHCDERYLFELEAHLGLLLREQVVSVWYDQAVDVGTEWKPRIEREINSADVILLLVSSDFLASTWCQDETAKAIERHQRGSAHVIPIILRPCDWHHAPFAKLQSLPANGKPVSEWRSRDKPYAEVAKAIRGTAQRIRDRKDRAANPNTGSHTVATETSTRGIELTIDADIEQFDNQKRKQLLEAIGKFLEIDEHVTIHRIRKGSVKVELQLTPEQVEKLYWAVKAGGFHSVGVVDARTVDDEIESKDDVVHGDAGAVRTEGRESEQELGSQEAFEPLRERPSFAERVVRLDYGQAFWCLVFFQVMTGLVVFFCQMLAELMRGGEMGITLGGPLWGPAWLFPFVLITILIAPVVVGIERFLATRRRRILPNRLTHELERLVSHKGGLDPRRAYALCRHSPSAASNVYLAMLLKLGRPHAEVERAADMKMELERDRLMANVRLLTTIAKLGPILGFLATTVRLQEVVKAATQTSQNSVSIDVILEGAYWALTPMSTGLLVTVLALVLTDLLERRISRGLNQIREQVHWLLPQLERFETRLRARHRSPGTEN